MIRFEHCECEAFQLFRSGIPDQTIRNYRASKSSDKELNVIPKRRSTDLKVLKFWKGRSGITSYCRARFLWVHQRTLLPSSLHNDVATIASSRPNNSQFQSLDRRILCSSEALITLKLQNFQTFGRVASFSATFAFSPERGWIICKCLHFPNVFIGKK